MIDIETVIDGGKVRDTDLWKAENLLTTNQGSLYYLPEFGINLDLFFSQGYNIQFESFKAYVTNAMVQNGISIARISETIDRFLNTMILMIGGSQ
jgi:hypothetical protein